MIKDNNLKSINNNGITLIALVVTIIILLILAAISINAVIGENGLIKRSKEAGEKHIIGMEKEALTLAYSACEVENLDKEFSYIRVEDIQLQEQLYKDGHDTFVEEYDKELEVTFIDTNHRYTIDNAGNIEYQKPLTPEEADKIVDGGWLGFQNAVPYGVTASGKVLVQYDVNQGVEIEKLDRSSCKIITENGIKYVGENLFIDRKGKLYEYDEYNYDNDSNITCLTDVPGSALENKKIVKVISEYNGNIVKDSEGKLYGWGYNSYGQLGNGTNIDVDESFCLNDVPGSALANKEIIEIRLGSINVAKDTDGKIYTWGENRYGRLGDGTETNRYIPLCISDIPGSVLSNKKIVDIIDSSTMIVRDVEGKLYGWGQNDDGQLGDGTYINKKMPVCISDIPGSALLNKKIKEIGYDLWDGKCVAIDEEGKVYTWGGNTNGQLGDGTKNKRNIPQCISDISGNILRNKKIVKINYVDYSNVEVKDENGNEYRWGQKDGSNPTYLGKNDLKGMIEVFEDRGDYNEIIIARDEEGKIYTSGENEYGRLGDGTNEDRFDLLCINDIQNSLLNGKNIDQIIYDYDTIIVKDAEGKLYGWGQNEYGQLGDGIRENKNMPISISDVEGSALNNKTIKKIIGTDEGYIAIDNDDKLYMWWNDWDYEGFNKPVCLTDEEGTNAYGEKITKVKTSNSYKDYTIFVTESGELLYRFIEWD